MLDALEPGERGSVVERAFATLANEPDAYDRGWEFFAAAELAPFDESSDAQARAQNALSWARQQSVSERAETLALLSGSLAEPYASQASADAFLALESTDDSELKETIRAFAVYLVPRDLVKLVDFGERRLAQDEGDPYESLAPEIAAKFTHVALRAGLAGHLETAMRAVSLVPEWLRDEALAPLVADLPVPYLFRAATLCDDTGVRSTVATRLAESKDWQAALRVLEDMVANRSFSSAEVSRGEAIAKVAAVAPRTLLPRLLSCTWRLPTGYDQAKALPTILKRLAPADRRAELERALESGDMEVMAAVSPQAARLPMLAASRAWRRALRRASRGGREDTYACIAALSPLITANSTDTALAICKTFADVDRWWSPTTARCTRRVEISMKNST
jgi:hypothetical protein